MEAPLGSVGADCSSIAASLALRSRAQARGVWDGIAMVLILFLSVSLPFRLAYITEVRRRRAAAARAGRGEEEVGEKRAARRGCGRELLAEDRWKR